MIGREGPTIGREGLTIGREGSTIGREGSTIGGEGPTIGGEGPTIGGEGPTIGGEGSMIGREGPTKEAGVALMLCLTTGMGGLYSAPPKRFRMKIQGFVFAVAAITMLAGCASDPRLSLDTVYLGGRRVPTDKPNEKRMNYDNVSYWDGDHAGGSPTIRISLGQQRAYFYKAGQLVGISILSTGREGYNTPTGAFRIQQKDRDHVSSIYGDYIDAQTREIVMKDIDRSKDKMPKGCMYDGARMPFFMRIHGGVGMHEGFLPGYPASHGCIRMPGFMAEAFFRSVDVGTPVTIEH
jgi:hypothetical protein